MPVLTPLQPNSPNSRPYSIFGQRFITTVTPAAAARSAAAASQTPNCIHRTWAPLLAATSMASSAMAPAASEVRNTSTMSNLSGMSRKQA